MNEFTAFKNLGLSDSSLVALQKKGFEEPTLVQQKIIPLMLNTNKDIIGQAQTGTGKTAAFGLPIMQQIDPDKNVIQALILTPTRELAVQVAEELNSLRGDRMIKIIPVYGGQSISEQFKKLKHDVQIVVGTPGRIIDHLKRKSINLKGITHLVLDEADEMLNMGFIEEVDEILKSVGPEKRMLLFSATMPDRIKKISEKHMKDYEHVVIGREQLVTGLTKQIYFEVQEQDKFEALTRIIDIEENFYGLIFVRTKLGVADLASRLSSRGYDADALHGDITQAQREMILARFKKKKINVLVATDVAARGIDIINLTHVINYSLPQNPEAYVHRIGRTGRAGNEGMGITFVTPAEYRMLNFIQRIAKTKITKEKLPEIEDVIHAKKERIIAEIEEIIASGQFEEFGAMAKKLLAERAPDEVLASVLCYALRDEIGRKNYKEIKDVLVDRKGTARLFIQLGKTNDLTKKKLADMIEENCGIRGNLIDDIQVFDAYSFITVPFSDAETILKFLNKKSQGRRPIAEIAKESAKRSSSPRGPRNFRDQKRPRRGERDRNRERRR